MVPQALRINVEAQATVTNIFISYRREDSAAFAGHLFDRLSARFGKQSVFQDIDAITPGAEFAKVIRRRVGACDALLAVIGKEWLTMANADGTRRLDVPEDYVKTEIQEALRQNKLVIPVLIEGAQMPKRADLPPDIAALAERNATEISESRFDYDFNRLIEAVQDGGDPAAARRGLRDRLRDIWRWIANPDGQRTLTFAGTSLTAIAVAAWTAYTHIWPPSPPLPGTTITIVITAPQYGQDLKRTEQQLLEAILRVPEAEKPLLRAELSDVQAKSQHPDRALKDRKATLIKASQTLEENKKGIPVEELKQAIGSLARGDTAPAEALFAADPAAGKEQSAPFAFQLGELAYSNVDYRKAYDNYIKAARLQPENPLYLNMAGRIAQHLGRYAEAESWLEKALVIRKASGDTAPSDVAQSLSNLALLYKVQAKYFKAEPLYLDALAIQQRSLRPDDPALAMTLNNLAALYKTENQLAKAEPLYLQARAIEKKSLRPDDPVAAITLNNLAALYKTQGQYAKAEPLYQEALAIREKALGPGHSDVAGSLNNLAELFYTQRQYQKAEPLYQRALAIYSKSLGADHPTTAMSLNNLAELYRAQGLYEKAEPLYLEALRIQTSALGPDHPDVAGSLNNLALLYQAQGRYAEAGPLYAKALEILRDRLPPDHPVLAVVTANYADCLAHLKKDTEAKQ